VASQPKTTALARRVSKPGGLEPILARTEEGETWTSIAASYDCSPRTLKVALKRAGAWDAVLEARRASADAHAEMAADVLDDLARRSDEGEVLGSADVSLARSRSEYRRWLAGVRDREQYGTRDAQATVNVTIGDLHLDALRRAGGPVLEAQEVEEE
jgi:hypothetical protein